MSTKLNYVQDWDSLARQANWSVKKLAKLCRVSTRTLDRHFLETTGGSPKRWLAEKRRRQAVELLQDGMLMKEAAAFLGYKYASSFSREFKKHWVRPLVNQDGIEI